MHKPGVRRSVHLFTAPFLWSIIGVMLIVRGAHWMKPGHQVVFLLVALVLGTFKSFLILDKSIRKSLARIATFQDGTCLGAVYSWKTWMLVVLMVTTGVIIRHIITPGNLIGVLYCAIGWALFFSSRHGWCAWYTATHNAK